MNKVIRFKGDANKNTKQVANFYIDSDKLIFVNHAKKQFVFTSQNATNNIQTAK